LQGYTQVFLVPLSIARRSGSAGESKTEKSGLWRAPWILKRVSGIMPWCAPNYKRGQIALGCFKNVTNFLETRFNLKMSLRMNTTDSYFDLCGFGQVLKTPKETTEPPMTSVLTPILSESTQQHQPQGLDEMEGMALEETREYLTDMLKELSAIARWAELHRARELIEAALNELEAKEDHA
jgi:hypothetical protein